VAAVTVAMEAADDNDAADEDDKDVIVFALWVLVDVGCCSHPCCQISWLLAANNVFAIMTCQSIVTHIVVVHTLMRSTQLSLFVIPGFLGLVPLFGVIFSTTLVSTYIMLHQLTTQRCQCKGHLTRLAAKNYYITPTQCASW